MIDSSNNILLAYLTFGSKPCRSNDFMADCSDLSFHLNTSWNFIANTGTTIATFLMVFLIQNTQNRDAKVIHLKLDELIRVTKSARNHLVDLEDLSEQEIEQLEKEFQRLRERGEARWKKAHEKGKK